MEVQNVRAAHAEDADDRDAEERVRHDTARRLRNATQALELVDLQTAMAYWSDHRDCGQEIPAKKKKSELTEANKKMLKRAEGFNVVDLETKQVFASLSNGSRVGKEEVVVRAGQNGEGQAPALVGVIEGMLTAYIFSPEPFLEGQKPFKPSKVWFIEQGGGRRLEPLPTWAGKKSRKKSEEQKPVYLVAKLKMARINGGSMVNMFGKGVCCAVTWSQDP